MSSLSPFTFSTAIQGVQVKPLTQDGQQIRVRYNGLLDQSGANQVWIHGGLGDLNEWRDIKDYVMDKTGEGWEQTIELNDKQFNFCFRDSNQNWDNNSGANWIYRIT
ncbi:Starch/carbohydrate-binding module (family 53) [Desulfotomaculum arcticum]|uniref:Starch/carbohydrate-binding module (Family 53) n=1 Tax=Desulfotruncus arcticus DSM 17038 TaxID=1121424 RepID=A0A1I2RXE7_9FIRM|nr:carbohydrate-binding protein [Desulfotruncus arcticus]SFG44753.1 Starch/carbohydrate-binding module (family 53) [Desulfotomaculum arcticum] [Desulfotruncus arcticus DSM 17038]